MAAGTLVIKTKMETDINDTVFIELADTYKPKFKEVMRLSDSDMNIIKGILNNSRNITILIWRREQVKKFERY